MFLCAKCNRILRTSGVHRIIRTKTGNLRAAGLCPPCATDHDVVQRRTAFWRTTLSFVFLTGLFGGASYLFLHHL